MIAPLSRLSALLLLLVVPAASLATSLPQPSGAPILVVSGSIANTNGDDVARFDRGMLEAIGTVELMTRTPWYDHVVTFEGVAVSDLLDVVGAQGSEVLVTALDNYRSIIPMSDFESYEVVLALRRDGALMPMRDKGPLFIVYPYDSDPVLQSERYYMRSVWQVKELIVR